MANVGHFQELNTTLNTVIGRLFTSQTLLKYLFYDTENPSSGADITNPSSLLFNNIYPFFKIPEPEDEMKTFVNVVIGKSRPYGNNSGFKHDRLIFDIVVHIEKWQVNGGVRPYFIMPEIDKLFNDVHISGVSLNKILLLDSTPLPYGNRFYGYRLEYKLSSNSNVCST